MKAIETVYKGYRFRSRLEARWAVFFDCLGEQYQYEPQGFELDAPLGRYLPDFFFPQRKAWLEVKPPRSEADKMNRMSIYAAGKIYRNCWRERLTGYVQVNDLTKPWPHHGIAGTEHVYVGPYFSEAGGHGMGHGAGSHGWADEVGERDNHGMVVGHDKLARDSITRRCMAAIDASEVFFAWIDTLDCYGTLIELGYAKARGKLIWVGIDRSLRGAEDEVWFAMSLAHRVEVGADPVDTLREMAGDRWQPIEVRKLYTVAKATGCDALMVYGDPVENDGFLPWMIQSPRFEAARDAARSARFEHGETPGGRA